VVEGRGGRPPPAGTERSRSSGRSTTANDRGNAALAVAEATRESAERVTPPSPVASAPSQYRLATTNVASSASALASMGRMHSGGCWRSPSITQTQVPRARAKPATTAPPRPPSRSPGARWSIETWSRSTAERRVAAVDHGRGGVIAVVDEEHLDVQTLERTREPVDERVDVSRFVPGRDEHGQRELCRHIGSAIRALRGGNRAHRQRLSLRCASIAFRAFRVAARAIRSLDAHTLTSSRKIGHEVAALLAPAR